MSSLYMGGPSREGPEAFIDECPYAVDSPGGFAYR